MTKALNISCSDCSNPYAEHLTRYLSLDFPANLDNKAAVFEAITTHIFGTGQTRFGPLPNPESQVAMRKVFRSRVEAGQPIPILVPWGSKKPHNDSSIDIAELGALKTLNLLQKCVKAHYAPGIEVSMRVEDVGGYYLFKEEDADARRSSEKYVDDFSKLIRILNLDFIKPVLESEMMEEAPYAETAEVIRPLIEQYLEETDVNGFNKLEELSTWQALRRTGWSGTIPKEQRDYYRQLYDRLFPGISMADKNFKLAKYFAGSLARYKLKATGARKEWEGNFIQLNFAPPAPGTPQGIIERRVHYRTLPYAMAKTHLPPWRAKGYIKVIGSDLVMKLTSFNDPQMQATERATASYSNGVESVEVRADMLIADAAGVPAGF